MIIASGFTWWYLIPGVEDNTLLAFMGVHSHTQLVLGAWLSCLVVLAFACLGRLGLERARKLPGIKRYYADRWLSPRNMGELFITGIQGMMGDMLSPKDVKHFTWLIGGLFAYILVSNLQGVIPGLIPPTENINTNAGMATASFVAFMAVGLGRDPKGFIQHLMGPVLFMAPLLFLIESVGLIVRPLSLTIRLTGNIFGDHTVFNIMHDLVPLVVPAAFLGLAIVVSVIQAFVFSLLSTIYIGLSVPHHPHDDHPSPVS